MECTTASNKVILGDATNSTTSNIVNARYIQYSMRAVKRNLLTNFPNSGPGTSAFIKCTTAGLDFGSSATTKTNIPMPPIQWVIERQNSMEFGAPSIFVMIVAPVVVKPETISNIQSIKFGMTPETHSGIAPTILIIIHAKATVTKPQDEVICVFCGLLTIHGMPTANNMAIVSPKAKVVLE